MNLTSLPTTIFSKKGKAILRFFHYQTFCFVFLLAQFNSGWALEDTTGSMDRPSAQPLPLPEFKPNKPPEGFELPKLPEDLQKKLEQRKLYIKAIHITGSSVFPENELQQIVEPYQQREMTIAELEQLRLLLTHYYVDRGYINSGAVIKADAYQNNELTINIIEGHIAEVRIKGTERLREGYIANRLVPEPEQPFKLPELQDNYQMLLADPLINRMNSRILPGSQPGSSVLDVDVTRAQPYHLSVFGNNQRPPTIGAEAFGATGQLRNLTGLGDSLDFTYLESAGSNRYSGGFILPVTDSGLQTFFHFDEGASQIQQQPLNKIQITSKIQALEGGLSYPLINTLKQRLSTGLLLAIRENETFVLGQPFSFVPGATSGHNQATVWRLFQDFTQRWDEHALSLHSGFSVGMPALGATPATPVPAKLSHIFSKYPSSEFFAWLGQAQYAWRLLDDGTQFQLRGNVQLSDNPLLPLERISIGGFNTVRGYRENTYVRDNGYSVSAELHYTLFGNADPNSHRLQLVPFIDYGEAWNYKATSNALFSAGLGLEWQLKPLFVQFYWGQKLINLQNAPTGDLQDSGIHFNSRLELL